MRFLINRLWKLLKPSHQWRTHPFYRQLIKQHAKDGSKSVIKTYYSLQKRLEEHEAKLNDLKYKSSVEREIRAFKEQISVAKQFMKDHHIPFT